MKSLYRVKISTDIMVFANNDLDAINIAKLHAANEITNSCHTNPEYIRDHSDIPDDWVNLIPYSNDGTSKTCSELLKDVIKRDTEEISKIVVENRSKPVYNDKSEVKKEPKPSKELEWQTTKNNKNNQPPLRFI
jgi:hypothetical protein